LNVVEEFLEEQLMSRDLHMRTAWVQTHPIESLTIRVERALEAAWISPGISSLNDV